MFVKVTIFNFVMKFEMILEFMDPLTNLTQLFYIIKIIEKDMNSSKWLILILPLLIVGFPTAVAQSNNTSVTNNTGGLSSESVNSAVTNSSSSPANLTVNSSPGDAQNNTGGLSSESVNSAVTNSSSSPANLTVNSSPGDAQNNTGGLSSESVTESKY